MLRRPGRGDGSTRRVRRRTVVVVGATALAGVAMAACGSSSSGRSSSVPAGGGPVPAAVASVARTTEAAGSATVTVAVSSNEKVDGSGPLRVLVDESADFATGEGVGTMLVAGLPASANPGAFHLLYTPSTVLLQTTGKFASLGGGKPWAEVQASTLGSLFASASKSLSGPLASLASAVIGQPTAAVTVLDTTAITTTGHRAATVDGAPATEYELTIDTAKAAASATGSTRTLFQSLHGATLAVTVWIDRAGRLVQLQATGTPPPATGSSGGGITGVLVTLSKFSAPVSVTVPPSSEIATPTTSAG